MIRVFLFCIVALMLTACGDTDNSEPPAELIDFEQTLKVEKLWSRQIGEGVEQQFIKLFPLFLDEKVIVADRNGQITALNAVTGDELWQVNLDIVLSGGVGGNERYLVLTSRNGHVILLDNSGKKIWQVDASSEVLMPAQIAADLVIVRSVDGKISALNLKDGSESWSFKRDVPALSLRGNSAPVIEKGYIFNGLDNGRLVALDILDGHEAFDIAVSTPSGRSELERLVDADGHAVIANDKLYMASYQGRVVSIDIRRSRLNWSRKLSTYSGVEHSVNTLYITDDKDHIWSLDENNGATLWKQEKLKARSLTRPIAYKNTLAVADFEGYIHWLSPFDGHFLARTETDGSGVIVPPMVYGNYLYVLTREGELYAFTINPDKS